MSPLDFAPASASSFGFSCGAGCSTGPPASARGSPCTTKASPMPLAAITMKRIAAILSFLRNPLVGRQEPAPGWGLSLRGTGGLHIPDQRGGIGAAGNQRLPIGSRRDGRGAVVVHCRRAALVGGGHIPQADRPVRARRDQYFAVWGEDERGDRREAARPKRDRQAISCRGGGDGMGHDMQALLSRGRVPQ